VALQPITAVTRDSALDTTYLAHIISRTIRPVYPTLIHHSPTSAAFTHAPNQYLPCLPNSTRCRLCTSRHCSTAPR